MSPIKRILRLEAPRSSSATLRLEEMEVLFSKGTPVAYEYAGEVVINRSWYQRPYPQRHINRWRDTTNARFLAPLEFMQALLDAFITDANILLKRATS